MKEANWTATLAAGRQADFKGGLGGRQPTQEEQMTAAAAATSQELSAFGQALGVSRPGTKYPVRGCHPKGAGAIQKEQQEEWMQIQSFACQ